jgi:hypothetical protein
MIPFEDEPPEVHAEYLRELAKNGVKEAVSVVKE